MSVGLRRLMKFNMEIYEFAQSLGSSHRTQLELVHYHPSALSSCRSKAWTSTTCGWAQKQVAIYARVTRVT